MIEEHGRVAVGSGLSPSVASDRVGKLEWADGRAGLPGVKRPAQAP
jgi:hypothetical protein